MALIAPFKAVRPATDKVHLVASRSFVSYSPLALKRKLDENPFTFIHIINPEYGQKGRSKPNSIQRFENVRKKYQSFIEEDILVQDNEEAIYIYRQHTPEQAFTGLICGISIDEYLDGNIKIHEHTITEREETFCKYLDTCSFNAEPVLLTFRENSAELNALMSAQTLEKPLYDFSTTDRHRHQLWRIVNKKILGKIIESFKKIPALYIADGHHRMASSALLGQRRRKESNGTEGGMYNFALAMLMSYELLEIKPFHRLITLNETIDEESLLSKISENFILKPVDYLFIPQEKRNWGLRTKSGSYSLHLKQPYSSTIKSEQLDAMILTRKILEPVFGILDQKTDKRIQFIPGNQSLSGYEATIEKNNNTVLFTLHPVDADELFDVADAGEVMPPKSTWIAPKLRSGLTIMSLD